MVVMTHPAMTWAWGSDEVMAAIALASVLALVGCGIEPDPAPRPTVSPTATLIVIPTPEPTATPTPETKFTGGFASVSVAEIAYLRGEDRQHGVVMGP